MNKKYWLRGAIIGAALNLLYTLITLVLFPIKDCINNDLCGFAWEILNVHNVIISDLLLAYNPPQSTFVGSLIFGLLIGALIGWICGRKKALKAII